MNLIDQPVELTELSYDGPIVKPESYLVKKWNKIPHRVAWGFICSNDKDFRKDISEKLGDIDDVSLNIEILDFVKAKFSLVSSDKWSGIEYLFFENENCALFLNRYFPEDDDVFISINWIYTKDENYFENETIKEFLIEAKKNIIFPEEQPNIYLIRCDPSSGMFETQGIPFEKPEVDLGLNYGKSFEKDIHKSIAEFIKNDKPKNGRLVMLHGEPGTGKTFYFRYLLNEIAPTKKVIYVPPYLVDMLGAPSFVDFLMEEKGSILMIEDAESILCSDDPEERSAGLNNLLQATDGILADCFDLKIIVTFNVKYDKIDAALKRRGRLFLDYQFGKLTKSEAQKKIDSMGISYKVEKAMTLADVYNLNVVNEKGDREEKKERTIGFGFSSLD